MNRKGFTLLEVLVVITLLGIVVGAAFSNFGVGLKGYKKGASRGAMLQEVRGGLGLLGSDIERMIPIRTEGMTFTTNSFSFLAATITEGVRPGWTTYSFGEGALKREASLLDNKEAETKPIEIIKGVNNAGFEYFVDGEWVSDLEGENNDKFPEALRVRIRLELDGEDGEFITSFMFPVSREIKTSGKDESRK